ncbi:hypothetical protein DV735_g2614, partial [Chaetothyriales sp. CBS 134920]
MPAPYANGRSDHAHSGSRSGSLLQSPVREQHAVANGPVRDDPNAGSRPGSKEKSDRTSNPMSFASILGPSNNEPSPPKPVEAKLVAKPASAERTPLSRPWEVEETARLEPRQAEGASSVNGVNGFSTMSAVNGTSSTNGTNAIPRRTATASETEKITKALAAIDDSPLTEVTLSEFDHERSLFERSSKKRVRQLAEVDGNQRKRRRLLLLQLLAKSFAAQAEIGASRFRDQFGGAAADEIADKDHEIEKNRKKEMQRKRRREQAMRKDVADLEELRAAQQNTTDAEEYERFQRQIDASTLKIHNIAKLNNGIPDDLDIPPMPVNHEGGTTSSFHLGSPEPDEPPKKRAKQGTGQSIRPKKSKEKKQAEKDAAEAGWAALQERDSSALGALKDDDKKDAAKVKRGKEPVVVNYDSKGYQQIYEQIWRDMARKDVPKVFRIKQTSLATRQDNLRKTAILASKQARKWQERTNKSMKDTQARAKRVMREMMTFWKRNEREERDMRRMAERKELEDAKKAEADREANRQKRKLNFLISQTELYSHFIGRKIKTDEVENSTNDPDVAVTAPAPAVSSAAQLAELGSGPAKPKVTNFEDLDFDAEDETALREAAVANAQNAVQEAQDRARAFDGQDSMAALDGSDLNFQNPTMAGNVEVAQPKMLQAQLKEYQLKGLNWLVNLYEQGINGILADEMGLGKTVQSISVMGYLAETYNVWGPFLVIAPSSTLHNWQQEITKFVPAVKVLPYWGNAKDRKTLRKFWDRKHITYNKDSEFHVLVTSYQLVVQDAQYFQKVKWQYMILDEAQAIKSSSSSRWKTLLGFHCRNRLLLTGTPIQNNMQELWALLHFIMPSLFDSHDEFSDWFSKDIENHAQSNTKLNQDQLKRLHMILKPFMLRRVKAHVQKELGDKVEKDVFCDLTYRQRAYYANLRSKISILDLLEKVTQGDDQDAATLMNLVMQFRKVCNHPDLFERADVSSPFSMSDFAETASFLREPSFVQQAYSIRNPIRLELPRLLCNDAGRLDIAGPSNPRAGFVRAGFRKDGLSQLLRIWTPDYIKRSSEQDGAFSFLRFVDSSAGEVAYAGNNAIFERSLARRSAWSRPLSTFEEDGVGQVPVHAMFNIVENDPRPALARLDPNSPLGVLCNLSKTVEESEGFGVLEAAARPRATAPPIEISAFDQSSATERWWTFFNPQVRSALYPVDEWTEHDLLDRNVRPALFPPANLLPAPASHKSRYTNITVPSMRRFVTDCGKLARLDQLLRELKQNGHRVLLYFQMTRMIDLMEEYLTYRNYKYCRLDGSTKLEDRRDTVHDFQTRPEIFIFLLSTRAGGLGINLTSADTVIFYDSDWNPTIDSQAMDRAHRLGQTKQVTVYRLITRGTIEERIRKRAMQKEEVQRVVITGGDGAGARKKRKGEMSLDDMYHEGEGHFEDQSQKASGAATPMTVDDATSPKRGPRGGTGKSKKAKTAKQRLAIIDAEGDLGMGGAERDRDVDDGFLPRAKRICLSFIGLGLWAKESSYKAGTALAECTVNQTRAVAEQFKTSRRRRRLAAYNARPLPHLSETPFLRAVRAKETHFEKLVRLGARSNYDTLRRCPNQFASISSPHPFSLHSDRAARHTVQLPSYPDQESNQPRWLDQRGIPGAIRLRRGEIPNPFSDVPVLLPTQPASPDSEGYGDPDTPTPKPRTLTDICFPNLKPDDLTPPQTVAGSPPDSPSAQLVTGHPRSIYKGSICIKTVFTSSICTSSICTSSIRTSRVFTSSICIKSVFTSSICTNSVFTSNICTSSIFTSSVFTSSICTSSVFTSTSSIFTSSAFTSSFCTGSIYTSSICPTNIHSSGISISSSSICPSSICPNNTHSSRMYLAELGVSPSAYLISPPPLDSPYPRLDSPSAQLVANLESVPFLPSSPDRPESPASHIQRMLHKPRFRTRAIGTYGTTRRGPRSSVRLPRYYVAKEDTPTCGSDRPSPMPANPDEAEPAPRSDEPKQSLPDRLVAEDEPDTSEPEASEDAHQEANEPEASEDAHKEASEDTHGEPSGEAHGEASEQPSEEAGEEAHEEASEDGEEKAPEPYHDDGLEELAPLLAEVVVQEEVATGHPPANIVASQEEGVAASGSPPTHIAAASPPAELAGFVEWGIESAPASAGKQAASPKAVRYGGERTSRRTRAQIAKERLEREARAYKKLAPLNAEWQARVRTAVSNGHGSLQASDLRRVVPLSRVWGGTDKWLNDEVVNEYLKLVVSHGKKGDRGGQVPSYHAFNSFFFGNLAEKGPDGVRRWAQRAKISGRSLLQTKGVFIPINQGAHWTLGVVSGEAKTITHYNSLGGDASRKLGVIKSWVEAELGSAFHEEEWTVAEGESPRQANMDDCGVFTVTSARQIMLGFTPMSFGAGDIEVQRQRIVAELVNGGLLKAAEEGEETAGG